MDCYIRGDKVIQSITKEIWSPHCNAAPVFHSPQCRLFSLQGKEKRSYGAFNGWFTRVCLYLSETTDQNLKDTETRTVKGWICVFLLSTNPIKTKQNQPLTDPTNKYLCVLKYTWCPDVVGSTSISHNVAFAPLKRNIKDSLFVFWFLICHVVSYKIQYVSRARAPWSKSSNQHSRLVGFITPMVCSLTCLSMWLRGH